MEIINSKGQWQVAEIKLSYTSIVKASERFTISSSTEASSVFRKSWTDGTLELQEKFKILLTNRANRCLGIFEVSSGGTAGTVADPKLIFAAALKASACGMILCHNHPSGNLKPSYADIELTKKLKEAGKFLEIQVLDHIIITAESFLSFADEGII